MKVYQLVFAILFACNACMAAIRGCSKELAGNKGSDLENLPPRLVASLDHLCAVLYPSELQEDIAGVLERQMTDPAARKIFKNPVDDIILEFERLMNNDMQKFLNLWSLENAQTDARICFQIVASCVQTVGFPFLTIHSDY
jgi:hypothetical protein